VYATGVTPSAILRAPSLVLTAIVFATCAFGQESRPQSADVYTKVLLSDVEVVSGEWPDDDGGRGRGTWFRWDAEPLARPILSAAAEGFLARHEEAEPRTGRPAGLRASTTIVVRSPANADLTATIFFSQLGWASDETVQSVRVRIPKAAVGNATRGDFLAAGRGYFAGALRSGIPGAAWFRHRLTGIEAELGTKPGADRPDRFLSGRPDRGSDEVEETYEFFSAGRAVAENLRLDRSLAPIDGGEPTIPVESIPGIDVKPFDWKAAVAKLSPVKDPLAALIPEDQHAAFFRNLASLDATISELEANAAPLLASATERSEDAGMRALYETQLGFKLKEAAFDPIISAFVKSVAVTGSDPYFATGTDVAVLLEAAEPAVGYGALELRQRALSKLRPDAVLSTGDVQGAPYSWLRTQDRSLSSIIARVGPAIVVTNSLAQLQRLVETSKGTIPALAASPEYVFFRDRYALGYVAETAFVLLTDATIRRWCGPKWRIGDARRTRAAAQLAELTAANADAIVRGVAKPGPYAGAGTPVGLGALAWTADGLHSDAYGSLRFLRPIIETDVSRVTPAEAAAYGQFRDAYQREWAQFFDPIAVRFATSSGVVALDVTVMPLVASSDYRDLMDLARSVRFGATACDPHDESLIHFTMAVDAAAAAMSDFENGARRLSADPEALALSWLKGGVSISVEPDPLFDAFDPERSEREMLERLQSLPIILTAEVKDPVSLALLLTGIRAKVEDMGLGAVRWTKGKHRDVETMTLSGVPGFDAEKTLSLRYTIVEGLLVVTLREDLLHQAIDRAVDRRGGKAVGQPWIGESAALRVGKGFVDFLAKASERLWDQGQRELAWRALPILTEWRRLWPDQDPVAVHEKLFKVRLVDPAGGRYVVDKDGVRIVSQTYGHPTETRPGPRRPNLMEGFKHLRAGLTFENDGVRARVVLEREGK
jgi:hypothetical protein